jgi:MFS family permease
VRRALGSAALAVAVLDVTAVGVMLPTLRADLGSSPSGGQWIMNAYLLALAVVLPLALRVRIDRRLVAGAGAAALALGAIVCATADSTSTLVIGRAMEGAGIGALIVPAGGGAAAVLPLAALALGPVVGGELAERNWWHLYFWAAVPAAALLGAMALRERGTVPSEQPAPGRREIAIAAALVAGTILLVQSEPWGLGNEGIVSAVGAGAIVWPIGAFGVQRGAWAAAGGALAALAFLMPQYFELAHLIHPLRSGMRLEALTIPGIAAGLAGWQLRELVSDRTLVLGGAVAAALGGFALLLIDEHSGNALFGTGLVLVGAGFGVAAGAVWGEPQGELLAAAAIGAAFTLAVSGALFQHRLAEMRDSGQSFEHALSRGAAGGSAMLLFAAAVLAGAVLRARRASSAARPAAES